MKFHENLSEVKEQIGDTYIDQKVADKIDKLMEDDKYAESIDKKDNGCLSLKDAEAKIESLFEDDIYENSETEKIADCCYSTYDERIIHTPREVSDRGVWMGKRGESDFVPSDTDMKKMLSEFHIDAISYKDGIPDFSEVAKSTVTIDRMTENRADNFRQCDEKCAEQWNQQKFQNRDDWSPRDVKEWRQNNNYSWHERNDMETCDLVPTKVNDYFGHLGGVSECRKRDESIIGGFDFDE